MLDIQNLSVTFTNKNSHVQALKNFSLTIGKGEILALVGESGSGKSVLALSLLGLLPSLDCLIEGTANFKLNSSWVNLGTLKEKQWQTIRGRQISLIFQEHMGGLNPVRTIGSQLVETILTHQPSLGKKAGQELALEMIAKVLLPNPKEIFNKYPFELSGGMGQRVMIALALVHKPKLLIADEPTTALDVTVQAQILDLLLDLKEELGTSILFISHDLAIVRGLADRVAIIGRGSLLEEGPVQQIFDAPNHPYTQALLQGVSNVNYGGI